MGAELFGASDEEEEEEEEGEEVRKGEGDEGVEREGRYLRVRGRSARFCSPLVSHCWRPEVLSVCKSLMHVLYPLGGGAEKRRDCRLRGRRYHMPLLQMCSLSFWALC